MLNKNPIWKTLLILAVLVLAAVYAIPNLYPPDPAIQITPAKSGADISEHTLSKVRQALAADDVEFFGELVEGSTALFRLADDEQQLPAKDKLQRLLGDDYVVALNRAPTTPKWLADKGGKPMTLGLDLSGGVHFLMEVDMVGYMKGQMKNYQAGVKRQLREEKIKYRRVTIEEGNRLRLSFKSEELQSKARSTLRRSLTDFLITDEGGSVKGKASFDLLMILSEQKIKALQTYAVEAEPHHTFAIE